MIGASATDVVMIGGGVAGLVAARAAAIAGADVVLLEAAGSLGGLVGNHRLAGVTLDSGAESFATRGGTVAALAEELGLPIVTPTAVPARILHRGTLHPLPAAGVLGIPTDLDAPGLVEVLGADGLARAREDLTLPTPGPGEAAGLSLAELIRTRMGEAVLDALVRPIVRGVHSVEPEELTAEVLLPRIHERLATHGSLAAALADLRSAAPAGSAVAGIDGGVHRLVTALTDDLRSRGVRLLTAAPARAVHRTAGGGHAGQWRVRHGGTAAAGATAPALMARQMILATAPPTWGFLDPAVEQPGGAPTAGNGPAELDDLAELRALASSWPPAQEVDLLTLVVRIAGLPAHERAGTLVAEPGHGAKALTYASAKWDWVGRAVNQGRSPVEARAVVRLSYGPGIVPAEDPQAQRRLALRDAGVLTGTEPWPDEALDTFAHTRLHPPAPVLSWATSHAVAALREAIRRTGALGATGAWVCGSGLASVVPDAIAAGRAAAAAAAR